MSRSLNNKNLNKYTKLDILGKGTYGRVYKAQNNQTNGFVALKVMQNNIDCNGLPPQSLREIAILRHLNHPNILRLNEVHVNQSHLYLVVDLMQYDLRNYLNTLKLPHQISFVKRMMKDLLEGLYYCHVNRIIHRDLKPQNLLLDSNLNLKIADFGLARVFQLPKRPYTNSIQTLWYRAPEVLFGDTCYSSAVDMWSVGCIMAELMTGVALFMSKSRIDLIANIFRILGTPNQFSWPGVTSFPGFPQDMPVWEPVPIEQLFNKFPTDCIDLLKRLLQMRPEDRISARDALHHPFIVNL